MIHEPATRTGLTGDKTLQRHIDKCNAPIMKYRETYRLSLEEYNVEPAYVDLVMWDPFFAWVKGLVLPPAKTPGETKEEYVQRCGAGPAGIEWVHTPIVNGAGERPACHVRMASLPAVTASSRLKSGLLNKVHELGSKTQFKKLRHRPRACPPLCRGPGHRQHRLKWRLLEEGHGDNTV